MVRGVVKRVEKSSFRPLHFVVADAARKQDGARLTPKLGFHQLSDPNFAQQQPDHLSEIEGAGSGNHGTEQQGSEHQYPWTPPQEI